MCRLKGYRHFSFQQPHETDGFLVERLTHLFQFFKIIFYKGAELLDVDLLTVTKTRKQLLPAASL